MAELHRHKDDTVTKQLARATKIHLVDAFTLSGLCPKNGKHGISKPYPAPRLPLLSVTSTSSSSRSLKSYKEAIKSVEDVKDYLESFNEALLVPAL